MHLSKSAAQMLQILMYVRQSYNYPHPLHSHRDAAQCLREIVGKLDGSMRRVQKCFVHINLKYIISCPYLKNVIFTLLTP